MIIFLSTAKVDKLDHTPTGDHNVGSFDVSMDDGIGVKVVEGSGDLTSVVGYCTTVQRTKSVWKNISTLLTCLNSNSYTVSQLHMPKNISTFL